MSRNSQIYDIHEGDIFTIPVDDGFAYVGQVVCEYKDSWYVVVFDHRVALSEASDQTTDALAGRPILGGIVFDARFRPGMWEIIGHSHVAPEQYAPAFTTGDARAGGVKMTNFRATKMREATTEEAEQVPRRSVNSPLVLEKAVRAHAGVDRWLPAFDDFLVEKQRTSVEVFGTL
ncbi:Imm26 family immunity protein [Microbacterium testaceum]|uniref:Imm26 family immunity protein n=1 Tax=Microbacterium testaceum TaxID=2033 RepID=UPI003424BAF1